jgi:hypothetical protein
MRQLTTSRRVILIVTVLLLVPAVVMAAIDSFTFVNSGGTPIFRIDLYGIDESNPPAVTYKYAVTDLLAGDNALSHWTLDLEQCAGQLASPTAGNYSTIVDPAVCGAGLDYPNCVSASYKVVTGNDPTTGLFGIKFEGDTLGFGQTHIFHITVAAETGRGPIDVAVKPGNTPYLGTITGPLCTPTAVTMSGASVASRNGLAFAAVAALTMILGVASIGVWRKNEK